MSRLRPSASCRSENEIAALIVHRPRYHHAACVFENYIIVYGGKVNGKASVRPYCSHSHIVLSMCTTKILALLLAERRAAHQYEVTSIPRAIGSDRGQGGAFTFHMHLHRYQKHDSEGATRTDCHTNTVTRDYTHTHKHTTQTHTRTVTVACKETQMTRDAEGAPARCCAPPVPVAGPWRGTWRRTQRRPVVGCCCGNRK